MTTEEAKKAGFRIDANVWATTWRILTTDEIRRLYSKVRGLDAKDFPTRAKAREALRRRKSDAEHAKWLADMRSQTTPITPEQAKQDAKDSTLPEGIPPVPEGYEFVDPKEEPTLTDCDTTGWYRLGIAGETWEATCPNALSRHTVEWFANKKVGGYSVYFARPKAEAEPLEWCERKKGEVVQDGDDVSDMLQKFDLQALGGGLGRVWASWTKANGWLGYSVGKVTCGGYVVRARYRNPLWLAKHGKNTIPNTSEWRKLADDELMQAGDRLKDGPFIICEGDSLIGRPAKLSACDDISVYRIIGVETKHCKSVESHETPVGETQGREVVTDETQHSPSRTLSDAEFKNLVGRMSLPQLYDALKANGVKLEGIGLEPKKVDEQSVLEEAAKVGNKYHRTIHGVIGGSIVVDVYNVLDAFGVTCPACQHAIKKLLCAGLRNKGSRLQDLTESKRSVERAVELEQQRNEGVK
jgi:hypothetical protein